MQQQAVDLTICEMYQQGIPIAGLARALGKSAAYVRHVLVTHHIPIRPVLAALCPRGSKHPSSKLSAEDRDTLHQLLIDGNVRHKVLAKRFKLTGERVRQIAVKLGAPTGVEIRTRVVAQEAHERQLQTQIRMKEREEISERRYKRWQELWHKGYSLAQMAKELGLSPQSIGVRMPELRQLHPNWFPYRRASSMREPDSVKADLAQRILRMWEERVTVADIARKLDIPRYSVYKRVALLRQGSPGVCPPRRCGTRKAPLPATLQP